MKGIHILNVLCACHAMVLLAGCQLASPTTYRCWHLDDRKGSLADAIHSAPIVFPNMPEGALISLFDESHYPGAELTLQRHTADSTIYLLHHEQCPLWRYTFRASSLVKAEYVWFEAGIWTWFDAFGQYNGTLSYMKDQRKKQNGVWGHVSRFEK